MYQNRYEGVRWRILFGVRDGVERFALEELQRAVQSCLPYVVRVESATGQALDEHADHLILAGTAATHPAIAELVRRRLVEVPSPAQGYAVACLASPWNRSLKLLVIAGRDPQGVLYGVEEFNAAVLAPRLAQVAAELAARRRALDDLPLSSLADWPRITNRGIWTWGYVIYDYRGFIDHMARLKMNMLTIWNDCPPLNCREIIDYAHARGVQMVLGFHWGWGIPDLDPTSPADQARIKAEVVRQYREEYRELGMDGIYFHTFTEQLNTHIKGQSIAALACAWVNDIAGELLALNPALRIQFGLHAPSIGPNYGDLKTLDPRVTIVWEDAGVLPYAYDPVLRYNSALPAHSMPAGLDTYEATLAYSKQLATFRGRTEFAMVPKGFICLRWDTEFEHHGPFLLGERNRSYIRNRLKEKQARWDLVNAAWRELFPYAARFYREILACSPAAMTVTGLIEDGILEAAIPPSVALFAATLWNPQRSDAELLQAADSSYYREAL
jgi:hypothetical protein